MAQQTPPAVGTVMDGYRFKGGDPAQESSWEAVGPVAAPAWGPGAMQLPDGSVVRYGPRGGTTVLRRGGGESGTPDLTEAQGKAVLYGGMMAGAERDYQRARQEGYNPASIRNQVAGVASIVPFDGDFFGRLIRDDVSDRGVQAERRWAEGNLRQLTGAAATEPEISRVAAINFDRGNDQLSEQRYRTRSDTYAGTKVTAGAGASVLPEYPGMPGSRVGPADETGLPTYPTITAATSGIPDSVSPPPPTGPGSSPETAIDYTSVPPDQLLTLLQNGGWVRQGNGQPYQVAAGEVRRAAPQEGDQTVAPGVVQRPQTPQEAASQRSQDEGRGVVRNIDAFGRGAVDSVTFGLSDEIGAGLDSVFGSTPGSRTIWQGGNISDAYRFNRDRYRAEAAADQREVPVARMAGQVAGALAPAGAGLKVAQGAGKIARFGAGVAAGAGFGGAYGFGSGEGSLQERAPEALTGAGIGILGGAVAPVAANTLSRFAAPAVRGVQAVNRAVARPVVNALGDLAPVSLREAVQPNALASGLDRFAARAPQDMTAIGESLTSMRANALSPTFSDVVNDGGRGAMRALATRQTPARQAAREFAEGRAAGLQDRLSTQARRTISDNPKTPDEIRAEIVARRSSEADQAFGAVRGEMVTPEPQVIEALRAPATRSAIEDAAVEAANFGDLETANLLRQLTGDALDNPSGVQITVGMADRLARTLNGRAEAAARAGTNSQSASLFTLADRLRGTARQQVQGYDSALQSYAADSRLKAAADLGEKYLTMEADQFVAAVNALSPEERQIAQAAARRAVERAAGTQGGAPGVAQRLANGREQGQRTAALLDNPQALQDAAGAELEALRRAQAVNPGQGSQTSMNLQDAGNAAGMVVNAARNPIGTALGAVANRIKSRGFSDAEAEAIVQAAIDPQQTDQLIAMLAQRMSRREARNLARAIRYQTAMSNPQISQQR